MHELCHGLIRILDEGKNSNFINNSKFTKNKKNNKRLKFKGLKEGEFYFLPINESVNKFEYSLYGGYYLNYITYEVAKLFLDIIAYNNKNEYI